MDSWQSSALVHYPFLTG